MTKKTIAGAAAAVAVAGMMAGCCCQNCGKEIKMYTNKDFYVGGTFDENGINQGGKFDGAKASEAYFDMMRRFGYPVYPALQNDKLTNPKEGTQYLGFWAIDFAKGDFMKYGMGGVIWVDEIKEEYFGRSGRRHGPLDGREVRRQEHPREDGKLARAPRLGVQLLGSRRAQPRPVPRSEEDALRTPL